MKFTDASVKALKRKSDALKLMGVGGDIGKGLSNYYKYLLQSHPEKKFQKNPPPAGLIMGWAIWERSPDWLSLWSILNVNR